MASSPHTFKSIDIEGLSVAIEPADRVASLRYLDSAGKFATAVREALGRPLAEPLRAIEVEHSAGGLRFILAWRSPTENILLCPDPVLFSGLERMLAAEDGCLVDQSGGIRVLRVGGARARDLLLRLGAASAVPEPGEALTARLAELPVLTIGGRAGGYLLLVERVYANHLFEWIHATAADFQ
jgi:sarcosine oxidase gamma subunit